MQFVRRLLGVSSKVQPLRTAVSKKAEAQPSAPVVLRQEDVRRVSGGDGGTSQPVRGW